MSSSHDGWREEKRSAYLYRVIADCERGTPREALFRSLAVEADGQAAIWASQSGGDPGRTYSPDLRTRIVAALLGVRSPRAMRGILTAMKVRGLSVYTHAAPGHPAPTSIEDMASRHRGMGTSGNLRAAVFGINDGLMSNLSLILGVAGASSNSSIILLSGVAGLLAGAFSMAAGEFVSVRSQREMYEYQIGLERLELEQYPEEEAEELALIYAAKGMPKDQALDLARKIIADPEQALDTLAREELGLNPEDLGSPWGAAWSSFASFAIGAVIPLLPFLLSTGTAALAGSIGLTAVSLFGVGAVISLFTGRNAVRDGLRMLGIGAAAGGVTFAVGNLVGVSLG
jgi:VIT1/CCC1 family predicted Fe2+/Mn2+ transporter